MKRSDDPVGIVVRKLDLLQERLGTFTRLQQRGATIDETILDGMENLYRFQLDQLEKYRAFSELRAYRAWYHRYLNNGDAL